MPSLSRLLALWRNIWTMLRDPNGPRLPKLIALITIFYLILPTDLIPDIAPFLGWLDDIGITALALRWLHRKASIYQS